ncbi:hypothetical protein GGR19_001697 [Croceicoccus naphthovorans]|nr:hypothetical protein [Croceicoccus naphthovorans]
MPTPCLKSRSDARRRDKALAVALDALRKIALNHPCDLHDRIAFHAVEEVKATMKGEPYDG